MSHQKATDKEREFLEAYKFKIQKIRLIAHRPATDINQEVDFGGYRIYINHYDEQKKPNKYIFFGILVLLEAILTLNKFIFIQNNWKANKINIKRYCLENCKQK